jgi:hypothetical protein
MTWAMVQTLLRRKKASQYEERKSESLGNVEQVVRTYVTASDSTISSAEPEP